MKSKFTLVTSLALSMLMVIVPFSANAADSASTSTISVYISENEESATFDAGALIQEIGTVSVKENLVINGNSYPMFCTFDNIASAVNNIQEESATVLSYLKSEYNLSDFSQSSANEYYDAMMNMLNAENPPEWCIESNSELKKLRAFFDIFENEAANESLESKVAVTSRSKSANVKIDMDLLTMLPYDSAESVATDNNIAVSPNNISTRAIIKGFNTTSGIAYAERHATSRNTSQYHSFSRGDCANFTSQILENGGVSQVVYDSVGSGWWHKKSTNWIGWTTHTHSQSWTMADVFTRYFGAGFTTKSNYSFSANIQAGDFISADFTSDGDWDHMGFVTAKAPYLQNDGYYDYRVAQHTTDYLAWASSSTNGWDTIGGDGGTYARVRR